MTDATSTSTIDVNTSASPSSAATLASFDALTPASQRQIREMLSRLLAGEVIRRPEEIHLRAGSEWAVYQRFRAVVEQYAHIGGFRVLEDPDYAFVFFVHDAPRLRETLDKATSRVAVACRLLYHRQQQSVKLQDAETTMREILDLLDLSGGEARRTARTRTITGLHTLARHGMIVLPPRFEGRDDERVVLTPVLPRRLPLSAVQGYLERTRVTRGSGDAPVPVELSDDGSATAAAAEEQHHDRAAHSNGADRS